MTTTTRTPRLTDACPACLRRGNRPVDTGTSDHSATNATYACRRCGHEWRTSWIRLPAA